MIKKLNRIQVEEKLKSLNLLVFTPREFQDIFVVSKNTASIFLSNNSRSGLFLKLRNGFYMLKDSRPSSYLIANRLYQPSYISLESALAYYHLIPETVYGVSSVTTKATQEFIAPPGMFSYQKIKLAAFTGYSLQTIGGDKVLIADLEKALADYLYFVDLGAVSLNERLSLAGVKRRKLLMYAKLFGRNSLFKLIDKIYA